MPVKLIKKRTIDNIGRVQIPKIIRELLDLNEGDSINVIYDLKTKAITIIKNKTEGSSN